MPSEALTTPALLSQRERREKDRNAFFFVFSCSPLSPRERGVRGVRASEGRPSRNSRTLWILFALALLLSTPLAAAEPRPLKVDDLFSLKTVGDPRLSPDGQWVAYTVRMLDAKEDAANTDIYMAP